MHRPVSYETLTSLPLGRNIFGSIPSSNMPYKSKFSSYFKDQTISFDHSPLLQLVIMVSSVNLSQHSGSGSITLDYKRLVASMDKL